MVNNPENNQMDLEVVENVEVPAEGALPQTQRFAKVGAIVSNVLVGIMGVLIVSMLFFLFQSARSGGAPTMFNHQIYIVRSNSMSPAFKTGSLILTKKIDPTLIKENDIITYQRGSAVSVTHRVVDVIQEDGALQFITRGDANNVDDPLPVLAEDLVGKVTLAVPFVGFALGFARTKLGFLLLLVIPGMLIIITQAWSLIKQIKAEKKKVDPNLEQGAD